MKDKKNNPRDLLRALKKRRGERELYEWRVQIHRPVEDILEMIQLRSNPDYKPAEPKPYTVTANFTTVEEARNYALMVRLQGLQCAITNNWTGEEYDEKEE